MGSWVTRIGGLTVGPISWIEPNYGKVYKKINNNNNNLAHPIHTEKEGFLFFLGPVRVAVIILG